MIQIKNPDFGVGRGRRGVREMNDNKKYNTNLLKKKIKKNKESRSLLLACMSPYSMTLLALFFLTPRVTGYPLLLREVLLYTCCPRVNRSYHFSH